MLNIDAKQMEKMMKQMGIKTEKVDADEVIIRSGAKEIVIRDPEVTKVNMGGKETFQVIGKAEEREAGASDDDVKIVVDQTGCSEEEAREALEEEGDIAAAILKLKG